MSTFTEDFDRSNNPLGGEWRCDGQVPKIAERIPTLERLGSTTRSTVCVTVNGVLYRSDEEVEATAGDLVAVHFSDGVPVVSVVSREDGGDERRYPMHPVNTDRR